MLSMVGGSALCVLWMVSAVLLKLRTAGRGEIYSGGRWRGRSGSFGRGGRGGIGVNASRRLRESGGGFGRRERKGHVWRGERGEVVGSRKVGEARGRPPQRPAPGWEWDWTGPPARVASRPTSAELGPDAFCTPRFALGRRGSCVAVRAAPFFMAGGRGRAGTAPARDADAAMGMG